MNRPSKLRRLGVFVFSTTLLAACGETVGTAGGGGSGGAAGSGGPHIEVVFHQLNVREFGSLPDIVPIPGARVCILDADDCMTTDGRGDVVLELPANREIAFTVEKEGYGSWVFANVTDERFPSDGSAEMATHVHLEAIGRQLDVAYPWQRGMVGLQRWPSRPGVRFVPVGPTAEAVGPSFYLDASTEEYRRDLTATTDVFYSPFYPLASGGFADAAPGVLQFELAGTAGDCVSSWAWPGDAPNRIRIPVLEGFTTYGSMRCDLD